MPRAGTSLGVVGAVIGLPGALLNRQANPNMSIPEFVARAFGVYEIAIQSGDLPPPPPVY